MSLAGRDKGNLFLVTSISENYAYLVDGKIHKIENPKRKKLKHIKEQDFSAEELAIKVKNGSRITNQEIKRILKNLGGFNV